VEVCRKCFGRRKVQSGNIMIPCPDCNEQKEVEAIESVQPGTLDKIAIPELYRGKVFNRAVIERDHSADTARQDFNLYLDTLLGIYTNIAEGVKLDKSYYIFAPQGYGKTNWVYSCMQLALGNGLSVTPYYDTYQYDLLHKYYRYNYEPRKDLANITDFYNADLCFIKPQVGVITNRDFQLIKTLLDCRARNGLPTIVVSRFQLGYVLKVEKTMTECIEHDLSYVGFSKMAYISVQNRNYNSGFNTDITDSELLEKGWR